MHDKPAPSPTLRSRQKRLTAVVLGVWLLASFGPSFFARELAFEVLGSPFYFWMAAQGSILVFIAIVVVYAVLMNHWEAQDGQEASPPEDHTPH
jgi:putative solute:sodium symporter small subunit